MQNTLQRIGFLLLKQLTEELDPGEVLELERWLELSEENRRWFLQVKSDKSYLINLLKGYEKGEAIREAGWAKIHRSLVREKPSTLFFLARKYQVAAVLLLLFSAGLIYRHFKQDPKPLSKTEMAKQHSQDLPPGANKATLTLSNGSQIILDSQQNGLLAEQGNTKISKQNGQLLYASTTHEKSSIPLYNTLATPRAGQFQITLPDGTKVWLNNASSLKYPTSFTGSERSVEVTGEAYFEVAKLFMPSKNGEARKKMPFIVHIINPAGSKPPSRVEVLGTHFNVMAYADEDATKTTLLEGSVRVINLAGQVVIKPGEQAVQKQEGLQIVNDINVEQVVAWKDGFFNFDGAGIKEVMNQIARWYDVEVSYQGKMTTHHFDGRLQRNLPLGNLLETLEATGAHFRVEGRKIVVTP